MALEPAGISLEAQNFNKFIKQLNRIEKSLNSVFDIDSGKLDKVFSKAEKSSKDFSGTLDTGIKKSTKGFSTLGAAATTGLGAIVIGATAAAAAIGTVGVAVFNVAQDTDRATKQIASSLGITASQAADKYNESLQNIFVDNPQAQFAEIAEAIALTERALDLDTAGIEQVAGDALKLQQTFGGDLQKTIGAIEQTIERFGVSGQQATDLLAFGLQNIPAEDLIDSVGEFSNVFANAGFSANEFFSVLSTGAAGGVLGTDKAADAVKEFQIRFLEGNKSLTDSFGVLGLNFSQLTQDVNTGQKTIADVFGLVVDRAGQVDLSVAANRAAIAGLGTQFEDLGAAAIAALDPDAIGFEDIAGSADKLDERFNNLGDAFTSIKRGALVALAPIGQTILELANSIVPKIKAAFEAVRPAIEAFAARIVPAFQFAGDALGRLGKTLGGVSAGASTFESVLNGLAFVIEGIAGGIEILARTAETFRQTLAFARAGIAAFGSVVDDIFKALLDSFGLVGSAFKKFISGDFTGAIQDLSTEVINFDKVMDRAGVAAVDAFKDSVFREAKSTDPVKIPIETQTSPISPDDPVVPDEPFEPAIQNLKAYQSALQQAEQLQRSFSRAAEDTALKLARANEDIARKQAQSISKLEEKQAKDRDKLLDKQIKGFDKFEKNRQKQIAKAEDNVAKKRKAFADKRKQDQQKLQRELQQAQEKFNLSQLQSERRFGLSEKRLRAEGDILALQQLRENRELERKEEKENFDISQKNKVKSAEETQKEQAKDLDNQIKELKSNLEDQRAELIESFNEQLAAQEAAQQEAKAAQQVAFNEQAAERAIQLQREEEDRRISQGRQLEDLGRSFAEQEGVTEEGTTAVANQLENVFGIGGTADNIMTGFAAKTENEFSELFKNLEKIVSDAEISADTSAMPTAIASGSSGSQRRTTQRFQEGGVVAGPLGSPQPIIAHAGETILPTHQRSFTMAAPVIPSQSLDVNMSGGFSVTGNGQGNEEILQAAAKEMTENFRIAVKRLARRN